MSSSAGNTSSGSITLAIDVTALEAVAKPRAVVKDAARWSRHVGVVAADPEVAEAFVEAHRIQQDFILGELDTVATLSKLRWEAETDRFVYIGTSDTHRDLAEHVGWEYLSIEDAAREAGWTLASDATILTHVVAFLGRLTPWGNQ